MFAIRVGRGGDWRGGRKRGPSVPFVSAQYVHYCEVDDDDNDCEVDSDRRLPLVVPTRTAIWVNANKWWREAVYNSSQIVTILTGIVIIIFMID